MKFLKTLMIMIALSLILWPTSAFAQGGIFASGGGNKTAGENFTVTVSASGTTFDSLQGKISVSGPVEIVSFSAGGATWLPGKSPANNRVFVGIASDTSSLRVATITLRGTSPGKGAVSVSEVKLAHKGNIVSDTGAGTSFTIARAPSLPDAVAVSSSTHPDQEKAYEATDIKLQWEKKEKMDSFTFLLNQEAETIPDGDTTTDTEATFEDKAVGQYFFHIRARNGDGWGPTTHFKINIKEPDPKVQSDLPAPTNIQIIKAPDFVNDIANGTVSGILIRGQVLAGYDVNFTLLPEVTLPKDAVLKTKSDENGNFEYAINFPVRSGTYQLTVQGQQDKVLTPATKVVFETSQKNGGSVRILSDQDANFTIKHILAWIAGSAIMAVLILAAVLVVYEYWKRKKIRFSH